MMHRRSTESDEIKRIAIVYGWSFLKSENVAIYFILRLTLSRDPALLQ